MDSRAPGAGFVSPSTAATDPAGSSASTTAARGRCAPADSGSDSVEGAGSVAGVEGKARASVGSGSGSNLSDGRVKLREGSALRPISWPVALTILPVCTWYPPSIAGTRLEYVCIPGGGGYHVHTGHGGCA